MPNIYLFCFAMNEVIIRCCRKRLTRVIIDSYLSSLYKLHMNTYWMKSGLFSIIDPSNLLMLYFHISQKHIQKWNNSCVKIKPQKNFINSRGTYQTNKTFLYLLLSAIFQKEIEASIQKWCESMLCVMREYCLFSWILNQGNLTLYR